MEPEMIEPTETPNTGHLMQGNISEKQRRKAQVRKQVENIQIEKEYAHTDALEEGIGV